MSRRNRFFIWLAGIITLLALSYASLPWVLAAVVKQGLSAQGLTDIKLRIGYPNWGGIRIHSLAFTAMAGNQQLSCEVPEVAVAYHLTELVTGSVAQIRIPLVALRSKTIPGSAPSSGPTTAAMLPVALLSGQWLSDLPVRELLLTQLKLQGHTATGAVYTSQLSGQLRNAQLQIKADMHLPSPQRPISFSLNASHTGEMHLSVSSINKAAEPILTLAVNPLVVDQDDAKARSPIKLNGVLTARLNILLPMLAERLSGAEWAAGLEGELNSQWQAQVSDTKWRISGEAAVQELGGRWRDQPLPRGKLEANFDVDPQRAMLQTTLHAAEQAVALEARGMHQFATGYGHADLILPPVVFTDSGFVLSRLLINWPYPFDITAGRLSGSARMVWQKAFDLHGVVQLDKLGGHYNQLAFAGLSGEVALAQDNIKGLHTTKDARLRVGLVEVGFPVEKMDMRLALAANPRTRTPIVQIKKFAAELLGGKVRVEPFELDFGRDKNGFVVQLEQIGLNAIMALEQEEGLQGSGVLDGEIPIEISSAGVVVTHGQLAARAPGGVIRFAPSAKVAALAQSNQGVGMVVKALSNFQYEVLDVISDYKPGGDLVLKVRLEGKNPDWLAGQSVHLNLNLEENIPALLRSLQLSGDITERMRKHFENTP